MRKIPAVLIIGVLLITIVSSSIVPPRTNYIEIFYYTHSQTKAFCDSENFCQDYQIFCRDKDFIGKIPITGAFIQLPKEFKDPRSEELRSSLC